MAPTQFLKALFRSDGADFLNYPKPDILKEDDSVWRTDGEFSRQMLAGINPFIILSLEEFPTVSTLDPELYGNQNSSMIEECIREPRWVKCGRGLCHPDNALLKEDGNLNPLVIELSLPHEKGDKLGAVSELHVPANDGVKAPLWQLAKAYVAVNDYAYHQLISHWLHTHAVIKHVSKALFGEYLATQKLSRPFKGLWLEHMNGPSPVIPAQLTGSILRSSQIQELRHELLFKSQEKQSLFLLAVLIKPVEENDETKKASKTDPGADEDLVRYLIVLILLFRSGIEALKLEQDGEEDAENKVPKKRGRKRIIKVVEENPEKTPEKSEESPDNSEKNQVKLEQDGEGEAEVSKKRVRDDAEKGHHSEVIVSDDNGLARRSKRSGARKSNYGEDDAVRVYFEEDEMEEKSLKRRKGGRKPKGNKADVKGVEEEEEEDNGTEVDTKPIGGKKKRAEKSTPGVCENGDEKHGDGDDGEAVVSKQSRGKKGKKKVVEKDDVQYES
uniref:Lipoxygenase domain-containing protein n=1 Tax=Chenopodium quinoa TaxID=63459 RepID=A0A803MNW7_CHEQI